MVIALVWNDVESFKRHLEDMRIFRQSHHRDLEGRFAPDKTEGTRRFITAICELALVPMLEMGPPGNSQN